MKLISIFFTLLLLNSSICLEPHSDFFKNELGIDFKNKPTIVVFRTIWCGPCIKALLESDTSVTKYTYE